MEKDRDGNIFIDQDPENFLLLVNYLRLRMNNQSKKVPEKNLPKPTYSLCYMLEYYGLMPAVYQQTWTGCCNRLICKEFTCEEKSYGTYELLTKTVDDAPVNFLYNLGAFARAGVSEFTVEFDKGTGGIVGWLYSYNEGMNSSCTRSSFDEALKNSIFLNITDRKLWGSAGILEENLNIAHMASVTKVICTYDGDKKYSIQVVDESGPVCGGSETIFLDKSTSYRVFPMISFSGKGRYGFEVCH